MQYVVFDLEMNQDFTSTNQISKHMTKYPFEIIQLGAVKLDSSFQTVATFNRYVKPTIYENISPFITELTDITTMQLQQEQPFPEVFEAFLSFINNEDTTFITWGMSDIKQLFLNAKFHELDVSALPHSYINIQPYASMHFGLPAKQLLRLQYTIEALKIPISECFHNAFSDAKYTGEIFKRIYHSYMTPLIYDPIIVISNERQPKKIIDFDKLFEQFEKMFDRQMNDEEREIIRLAYHMGKSNQFQSIQK